MSLFPRYLCLILTLFLNHFGALFGQSPRNGQWSCVGNQIVRSQCRTSDDQPRQGKRSLGMEQDGKPWNCHTKPADGRQGTPLADTHQ